MFAHCKTLDELNTAYRQQAKLHHPDKGGDAAKFQQVREAMLKRKHEIENPQPKANPSNDLLNGLFNGFVKDLVTPDNLDTVEQLGNQMIDMLTDTLKSRLKQTIDKASQKHQTK